MTSLAAVQSGWAAAFVAALLPSPLRALRSLAFRKVLHMTLADALKPVEAAIVDYTLNELISNKAAVIKELAALETPAITHIADFVIANLPKGGLLSVVAGPLGQAIAYYETQIIASLGGEDEALFALVVHEATQLKTEVGLV